MKTRYVKVTHTGYFQISEKDLEEGYQAKTFEEAVDNQQGWLEDDDDLSILANLEEAVTELKLMPEDFTPPAE